MPKRMTTWYDSEGHLWTINTNYGLFNPTRDYKLWTGKLYEWKDPYTGLTYNSGMRSQSYWETGDVIDPGNSDDTNDSTGKESLGDNGNSGFSMLIMLFLLMGMMS